MKSNRNLLMRLLLLVTILTATIGAGVADMTTDIVPMRPYTSVFRFTLVAEAVARSSILGDILVVSLIVLLIASLIAAVANRTTGIVIAHTGFTPNANLTATPGLSSVMQLYPLIFVFIGLFYIVKHMKSEEAGI
jgi:hypothetical protein